MTAETTKNALRDLTKDLERGLDIYEEKEFSITVNTNENTGEFLQIVTPYVYACPTYYDTTTVVSTIAKKRIHTKVNIKDLFEEFNKIDKNPDIFNLEYEYNGIFIGKIESIEEDQTAFRKYIVNNSFSVSSSNSLHVIIPYDKPASVKLNNEYNNKIVCDMDNNIINNKTKDYYISTSYGKST